MPFLLAVVLLKTDHTNILAYVCQQEKNVQGSFLKTGYNSNRLETNSMFFNRGLVKYNKGQPHNGIM